MRLKCDGTHAETRFCISAKRTSPPKSTGASVQSTTGSRGVCICGSNAGYTMFRGSVKSTGYTLHSPISLSLPLPYVTVCHHNSTGLYLHSLGNQNYKHVINYTLLNYTICNLYNFFVIIIYINLFFFHSKCLLIECRYGLNHLWIKSQ